MAWSFNPRSRRMMPSLLYEPDVRVEVPGGACDDSPPPMYPRAASLAISSFDGDVDTGGGRCHPRRYSRKSAGSPIRRGSIGQIASTRIAEEVIVGSRRSRGDHRKERPSSGCHFAGGAVTVRG